VGAHHPFRMSNTALFHHCFGWRGINVEANPAGIREFEQLRPNDINVCAFISDREQTIDFQVYNHPAASTADAAMIARQADNPAMQITKQLRIKARSLRSLLDETLPAGQDITLLSVDIEGFDFRCLASNDWSRFRPLFILVEDHTFDPANPGGST